MAWGAIASAVGSLAGNLYNDYRQRKADKRQYKYNSWLQDDNQEFQREMAQNAHQYEMQDLQAAGLNPALTVTGSSAGAIAGSSAAQGTSPAGNIGQNLSQVISDINTTRTTNANVDKTKTETNMLPQQLDNETTSAKANLINAQANKQNADTQEKLAESGRGGQLFGTENGGLASSILAVAAPFLAGGIGMGALKGIRGIQALKASRGFGNFLKSLNSAK